MQDDFKNHVHQKLPFLLESKLVLAISGGVDSVVLAHLCKALNLDFSLAHCNFNLREKESNADEEFVLDLADELNIEVFIQNFDTKDYAKENKRSIQMAARELRYDWFAELAEQLGFDYILTAHHADDNLETFLINFTRGTGLNGLTGIPMLNDNIVRPLLPFSREHIEAYANKENIKWREDSSNSSRKYLRNKLRHEVVPILKEINPQLLDSFKNTLNHLNDAEVIIEDRIDNFRFEAVSFANHNYTTYDISAFKALKNPKAYLFEIFKDYGFTEWGDVYNLLDAQSGKQVLSSTHRLVKDRTHLILANKIPEIFDSIFISQKDIESGFIETLKKTFTFQFVEEINIDEKKAVFLDFEKLNFPLEIRLWKEGDYFQPIGMAGKKKLSKYLKDEKASLIEKENTLVLTSNNQIVWIVGKRADERFKVDEGTKKILKIN
ncbi:tRNA lysidine(34) synthetase TilS [Winogradskyella ursingii]|uniref:tRNA lysidine(34) synthetase TilS n=1 Tax=Winogradskyella ursingii TaxID=2686079 RepID=UPI0015C7D3A2|nr:tRNA lysidine(34) synthetase TilS [Winogradskyella ursingii]